MKLTNRDVINTFIGYNDNSLFNIYNMEKLLPKLLESDGRRWIDNYRPVLGDNDYMKVMLDEIDKKYSGKNYIPWDCRVIGNTLESIEELLNLWKNENRGGSTEKAYLRKCDEISQNFLELCNELQEKIKKYIEEHPTLSKAEQRQLVGYLNKLWKFYKNAPLTLSSIEEKYIDKGWVFGFIEDKRTELLGIASKIQSLNTQNKLNIEDDMTKALDIEKMLKIILQDKNGNNILECNEASSLREVVTAINNKKNVFDSLSESTIEELYELLRNSPTGNFYYIQAVTNKGYGSVDENVKSLEFKIKFLKEYFGDLHQFFEMHGKQERSQVSDAGVLDGILEVAKITPSVNVSGIQECATEVEKCGKAGKDDKGNKVDEIPN